MSNENVAKGSVAAAVCSARAPAPASARRAAEHELVPALASATPAVMAEAAADELTGEPEVMETADSARFASSA